MDCNKIATFADKEVIVNSILKRNREGYASKKLED